MKTFTVAWLLVKCAAAVGVGLHVVSLLRFLVALVRIRTGSVMLLRSSSMGRNALVTATVTSTSLPRSAPSSEIQLGLPGDCCKLSSHRPFRSRDCKLKNKHAIDFFWRIQWNFL